MPTDAELLRQYARDRSEGAFAELLGRHIGLVYSAAVRRTGGDEHLAQEITQDVFLVLARRAGALADHPALAAWLYATARNATLNRLRAEHRRRAREWKAHAMSETEPGSSDREWEQLRPVLDEAMDGLAEADRRAIILRFFEGRSYAEIGAALAMREETARMRIGRAMEKLRLQLNRRGVTSAAGALSAVLTTHSVSPAPSGLAQAVAGAAAAAPAAPALWLNLFQSMTTTKAALTAGASGVLLFAGAAVHNTLAEARLRSEWTAAQASVQQADTRLQALRREAASAATAEAPAAPTGGGPAAPGFGAARGGRAAAEAQNVAQARANAESLMASHPEIRKAWSDVRTATTLTGLVNLLRASPVVLTPERQGELLQAMNAANHVNNAYSIDGKTYAFSSPAPSADNRAEIAALVGGNQVLQDLERTADPRAIASDVSSAALESGAPMSPEQIQRVVRILAENTPDYRQGRSAGAASIDWDAALAQTQAILGPAQEAALAAERQQVQFNVALRGAMAAGSSR